MSTAMLYGDGEIHTGMRVLVACEQSGIVRTAFRRRGHDAWSCDIDPARDGSVHHIRGDVLEHLRDGWDMMIAHPPCTHLCCSGARWFEKKRHLQGPALEFVRRLLDAPIPQIALENPVGIISTRIRRPDQTIQPWQFGEDASKRTCLWLKNLPKLRHTEIITKKRYANQSPCGANRLGPSPDRPYLRSRTYYGIAEAMAEQWGAAQ